MQEKATLTTAMGKREGRKCNYNTFSMYSHSKI
jgi:hypothetical protein